MDLSRLGYIKSVKGMLLDLAIISLVIYINESECLIFTTRNWFPKNIWVISFPHIGFQDLALGFLLYHQMHLNNKLTIFSYLLMLIVLSASNEFLSKDLSPYGSLSPSPRALIYTVLGPCHNILLLLATLFDGVLAIETYI